MGWEKKDGEFYKRQKHCKPCERRRYKEYYRGKARKRIISRAAKRSSEVFQSRVRMERHLKVACEYCGYKDHPEILQFHHRDRKLKEFGISSPRGRHMSWGRWWAEILKCDVVCPNCHAVATRRQDIAHFTREVL